MELCELIAGLHDLEYHVSPESCICCAHKCDYPKNGCVIIKRAADELENLQSALCKICTRYSESRGTIHSTLRDVLRILGYDKSLDPVITDCVYDFQLCADAEELKQTMGYINSCRLDLISVTQDASGVYTVFFRRPIN